MLDIRDFMLGLLAFVVTFIIIISSMRVNTTNEMIEKTLENNYVEYMQNCKKFNDIKTCFKNYTKE